MMLRNLSAPHSHGCRIRREELGRHQLWAISLFLAVGSVLAVTIIHNNIAALVHGHHSHPVGQSAKLLSDLYLVPDFKFRTLTQI